ncbi:unnamed protein product [Gongylonema pulchrum]|uniref:Uncharacterized protein n=1 Tax=Gongylonema pulchrum TaxID=637853 RepID=A0A3P6QTT8_9BILA|nr:unnamed protein product [Gongylonema pulchrum]
MRDICDCWKTNTANEDARRMLQDCLSVDINSTGLKSQLDWISLLEDMFASACTQRGIVYNSEFAKYLSKVKESLRGQHFRLLNLLVRLASAN